MFMPIKKAYARLTASEFGVSDTLGNIDSLRASLIWVFNLLKWLGWAGVIVGVGFAIFMGIYSIAFGDSEETMTKLKGALVKAVLIVLLGILLLSAGFILKVVAGLVDVNILFNIPERI